MQPLKYITGQTKQIAISIPIAFKTKNILFAKVFCFKKHRITSPHKIVTNVDIGMLLT